MAYPVSTKRDWVESCKRLGRDYQPKFDAIGGGVNPWANATTIGVEILFDKKGRPAWDTQSRYANRQWPLGPVKQYRSIEDAEREVRANLDIFLAQKLANRDQA